MGKKIKKEIEIEKKVTLENYNSSNDFLFYVYLCREGNELQQKTFLEAIGIKINGKLEIKNETIAPELINRKKCILDFLAETDDSLINIELQQRETNDFNDRITYYMSKLARLEKGKTYDLYKKIIIITITNYKMTNTQKYKNKYKIINTENLNDIFTNKIEIITLELEKFRNIKKNWNNKEHLYLNFIDNEKTHKERKEMGKMDEGLQAAVKRIEEAIQSDDELRIYHKIELEKVAAQKEKLRAQDKMQKELKKIKKQVMEKGMEEGIKEGIKEGMKKGMKEGVKEGIEQGMEKGMEKGREKGREEEKIRFAINSKKEGIPLEKIAKLTGLSQAAIKKL